jgi:hypothetical protein
MLMHLVLLSPQDGLIDVCVSPVIISFIIVDEARHLSMLMTSFSTVSAN